MSTATVAAAPREFAGSRLLVAGLSGGAIAALTNLVVYFAAKAAGVAMVGQFDSSAPASTLPVGMVILASVVPALVATGLLAAMNRFMARPSRVFAGLASVGALLSMGGPLTLEGADGTTKAALALMHVIAAVAISGALLLKGRTPS